MRASATQHVMGVVGQVAAVLPLLLVTVYLSRTVGLETAGLFTVMVGASAAAYSIALWGLRTSILMERFELLSPGDYLAARLIALSLASLVIVAAGFWLRLGSGLIVGVILLRGCDGLVDLNFAITQVRVGTAGAIKSFAAAHITKLLILAIGMAVTILLPVLPFQSLLVFSAASALIFIGQRLIADIRVDGDNGRRVASSGIRQVFANAAWFAIAAAVCAIVTSAPRVSLKWLYTGDQLGVIGVSLSASTFFGMVFYTTWIRYLPRFDAYANFRRVAWAFLIENLAIAVFCFFVSWLLLPSIIAFVFGFSSPEQSDQARRILIASVLFFAGMNTCNLYKVTGAVWMETVAFAVAIVLTLIFAQSFAAMRQAEFLLATAGSIMLIIGLFSAVAPARTAAVGKGI